MNKLKLLKIFFFIFFILSIFITGSAFAQNDTHPENAVLVLPEGMTPPKGIPDNYNTSASAVNKDSDLGFCQNQYKTISVLVKVDNITDKIVPGNKTQLKASITNTNEYPIVNAEVLVKVVKLSNNEVVQTFSAKNNLSLLKSASEQIVFDWEVPQNITSGSYQMNFFVRSYNKFDISGISSSNNISAGAVEFSIVGGKTTKEGNAIKKLETTEEVSLALFKLPVVMNYPLEAGKENTLFSCVYNVGRDATTTPDSRLALTLKDKKGNVIYSFTKEIIPVGIHLASGVFVPKKDYKTFSLEAELYRNGKVVDSVAIAYDCNSMGVCQEKSSTTDTTKTVDTIIVVISLIILGLVTYLLKRKGIISIGVFLILMAISVFSLGSQNANASTYTVSGREVGFDYITTTGTWSSCVDWLGQPVEGCVSYWVVNGTVTSIGTHNKCVLTGYYYDGDPIAGCIVEGSAGGAWTGRVTDEGNAVAQLCYILCTDTGVTTGAGSACTAASTGKAGVLNSAGNCCTGSVWDAYGINDISCTVPPPPTATLSASPTTVSYNTPSTLSWSSTNNATSCTAGGAWSGTVAASGSISTGNLTSAQTYTIYCTGPGGNSSTQSVTVTLLPPTATISASPAIVSYNTPSTLSWSSTDATSCTAGGAWSGTLATSGSASTENLITSTTYTIYCTGYGGNSSTQSVTVLVPTATISASPASVSYNTPSTLSWSSTNATSCVASGAWSGVKSNSGTSTASTFAMLGYNTGPVSLAFDSSGNLYTANYDSSSVSKITSAGLDSTFATLPSGSSPRDLVFDSSGNLYTANYYANKISKITSTGSVSTFATLPSGSRPISLIFDSSGNLYTANYNSSSVSKITTAGVVSLFATLPSNSAPRDLVFDSSGNLYTANYNSSSVSKITPAGVVSTFATLPTGSSPTSLAFDVSGNLYIANYNTSKVSKVTSAGVVSTFATLPSNSAPRDLVFDSLGNLYTANYNTSKVSKVTSAGVVSTFATLISGSAPYNLIFDSSGNLYTTNYSRDSVSKITPQGFNTGNLTASQTYTIYCTQSGANSDTKSVTIDVDSGLPIASITSPAGDITIPENQNQQFTGEATDADGTIVGYEWRIGNCTTGTLTSSLISFVQTFFTGTYNVYLRAQDNDGLWSTNCPFRVVDVTPNNQIPGVCGSANGAARQAKPTTNLCSTVGLPGPTVLPTDINILPESGIPSSWTWTCSGENGGASASCTSSSSCGDNICQRSKGENPSTCRADCKISIFEF